LIFTDTLGACAVDGLELINSDTNLLHIDSTVTGFVFKNVKLINVVTTVSKPVIEIQGGIGVFFENGRFENLEVTDCIIR